MIWNDLFDLAFSETIGTLDTNLALSLAGHTFDVDTASFWPTLDVTSATFALAAGDIYLLLTGANMTIYQNGFALEFVNFTGPPAMNTGVYER